MNLLAANKYWSLDFSPDICHECVAFKPSGQKAHGPGFCFLSGGCKSFESSSAWESRFTLLFLHALSDVLQKNLKISMSGLAKVFLRPFREIKTRKSTDVVKTDGTFIFFPKYLQRGFWRIHLCLISHVLNTLLLWEFETAWCCTLGETPQTFNSHRITSQSSIISHTHTDTDKIKKQKRKKIPQKTPPAEQKQVCK